MIAPSVAARALLMLLVLAHPARSAAEPARMAIPDVVVSGTLQREWVEGLSGLILTEAHKRPGVEAVGSSDIEALLGLEAQKMLLGCGDSSCFAEIGGALGVEYLLRTEISRVGQEVILTMSLLDVRTAKAVARSNRRLEDGDRLASAAVSLLGEVLAPVLPEPAAPRGRGALAWTATGAGVVAAVAGGVLYANAWGTYGEWQASPMGVTDAQIGAARWQAPVGLGLALAGGALFAGSFFLPAPAGARIVLTPTPGGLVAGVRIHLE